MKKNSITILIAILLLLLTLNYISPNVVYAMGTDELSNTEDINLIKHNVDYDNCLRDETMCPKRESRTNPVNYWMTHSHENDAYAIKQKNIHLYDNPYYRVEPIDYPIKSQVSLKSKIFWFIWKKHTDEFDSASHFEESIGKSFSIRYELLKDIKKIFK